jgi:hypothetical protein
MEQMDDVASSSVGIGQDEVGMVSGTWDGGFEIAAEPSVGCFGEEAEGEIVNGENSACSQNRGQDEVGKVTDVLRANKSLDRERKVQTVPQDSRPPFGKGDTAEMDVGKTA